MSEKKAEVDQELRKRASASSKVATRRRQLDEPTKRRTSASPSKIRASDANVARSKKTAAAAESRFTTPAKKTTTQLAREQQEQRAQKRRKEVEASLIAKCKKVQQHLDAHIKRLQNMPVRNLHYNREEKMEHRIKQRYYAFRDSLKEEFQTAAESGVLSQFDQCKDKINSI